MLKGKQGRKEAAEREQARRAAEANAASAPADEPAAPPTDTTPPPPDVQADEIAELEAQIAALEQSEAVAAEAAQPEPEQAPLETSAPTQAPTLPPADESAPAAPDSELAELRAEVVDLREVVDDLLTQVESLRDFRDKAVEVVTSTAEEAVRRALESTEPSWLPKVEQILREVRSVKEASAKADAEVAEVRLHLPRLRQLTQLDSKLERMEKAARVVEQGVARLTAKTPTAAPAPTRAQEDPLA